MNENKNSLIKPECNKTSLCHYTAFRACIVFSCDNTTTNTYKIPYRDEETSHDSGCKEINKSSYTNPKKKLSPKLNKTSPCRFVNAFLDECNGNLCLPPWTVKINPQDSCVNIGAQLTTKYDIIVSKPTKLPKLCFSTFLNLSVSVDAPASQTFNGYLVSISAANGFDYYKQIIFNPPLILAPGENTCIPISDCVDFQFQCNSTDNYVISATIVSSGSISVVACNCIFTISNCSSCYNLTTKVDPPELNFQYNINSISPNPTDTNCGVLYDIYQEIINGLTPTFPVNGILLCDDCFTSTGTNSFTIGITLTSVEYIDECPHITEIVTLMPSVGGKVIEDECRFIQSCKNPNIECKTPKVAFCPVIRCVSDACVCKQSTVTYPPAPYCCNYTADLWFQGILSIPDGAETLYIINSSSCIIDANYCLAPWTNKPGCIKCELNVDTLITNLTDVNPETNFYKQFLSAILNIQNSGCLSSLINDKYNEVYNCICASYRTLSAAYSNIGNSDLTNVLNYLKNFHLTDLTNCLKTFNENALIIRYDTEISNTESSKCTLYIDFVLADVCIDASYSYELKFYYTCPPSQTQITLGSPITGNVAISDSDCDIDNACSPDSGCVKNRVTVDYSSLVENITCDNALIYAILTIKQGIYAIAGTPVNIPIPPTNTQICVSDRFSNQCGFNLNDNFDDFVNVIYKYFDKTTQTWKDIPLEDKEAYYILIKTLLQNPAFHSLSEHEWFLLSTYGQHYEIKIQTKNCPGICSIFENVFTLRSGVEVNCLFPDYCYKGIKYREVSSSTYDGYQFPSCNL